MISWDKHVHMLLYGVSMRLDPLPYVEQTLMQYLGDPIDQNVVALLLEHVEIALASDEDLSARLDQVAPDAAVRTFLQGVRERLLTLRGAASSAKTSS